MNEAKPDFSTSAHLFPHINREGMRFGTAALVLAFFFAGGVIALWFFYPLAAFILGLFALPLFLLSYGVFLFFRDPERYPPDDSAAVLSPADGRICLIGKYALPPELDAASAGLDPAAEYWRVSDTVRIVRRGMNPRLNVEGVLLTMFDGRTNLAIQVAQEVKRFFPGKVYATVVPRNVRLSEAPSHGKPITAYDRTCRGAEAYRALAEEFLKKNS